MRISTVSDKALNVRVPTAALHSYFEDQVWQVLDIRAAVAEADRGEFATDEEVNRFFAKYGC